METVVATPGLSSLGSSGRPSIDRKAEQPADSNPLVPDRLQRNTTADSTLPRQSSVFSFDVFDTAITRTIYPPSHVWLEVGRRLAETKLARTSGVEEFAHTFAAQRYYAERKAVDAAGVEDGPLRNAYRNFEWLSSVGVRPADAFKMELVVEAELVGPIAETQAQIRALQRSGNRVVFISDTYLPRYAVLRLLRKCGYEVDVSQVYVSGDLGLTKFSGTLFDHVLQRENVSARDLVHTGDNSQSDITSARRRGIRANWCAISQSTRYEQSFGRHLALNPSAIANCVGLLKAARMAEQNKDVGPSIAAGVIAPMITCFASWVLQEARRQGADLILFIARDAEVIHRAAVELADDDAPPFRVFESSRRSVFSSLLDLERPETIANLLTEPERTPLREVLRRFHLEPDEIESAFSRAGRTAVLAEVQEKWDPAKVKSILADTDLLELVRRRTRQARDAFTAYCRQAGLFEARKLLFVDVGWRGSYHRIVRQIAADLGIHANWSIAYFGLAHFGFAVKDAARDCVAYANRYGAFSHDCEVSWDYERHVEIIEAVCTASPGGPVVTYREQDGIAQAVRRQSATCNRHAAYAAALHEHVARFAAAFKLKSLEKIPAEAFRAAVLANLRLFVIEPRPEELSHLLGLSYLSGFDNSEVTAQPVTVKLETAFALRLLLARLISPLRGSEPQALVRFRAAKHNWPGGTEVLAPRWFRKVLGVFRAAKRRVRRVEWLFDLLSKAGLRG